MTTKPLSDGESPSTSSLLLPRLRHSRRGSLTSLSSASRLDKDSLAQALDQIHSTACQTETLTTFNEYTSPPPSSSGADVKGIASEIQGGLSGLYNRFRASVGNVADAVGITSEDVVVDTKSLKRQELTISAPEPSVKRTLNTVRTPGTSVASTDPSQPVETVRQSLTEKCILETGTNGKDLPSKLQKPSMGAVVGISQTSPPAPPVSYSSLAPLAQATSGIAARPTVAEINVSATKVQEPVTDAFANGQNTNSIALPRSLLLLPTESTLNAGDDKQASEQLGGSHLTNPTHNTLNPKSQITTPTAGGVRSVVSLPGEQSPTVTSKLAEQSGTSVDKDYFFRDQGLAHDDGILHMSTRRPSGLATNVNETQQSISNSADPNLVTQKWDMQVKTTSESSDKTYRHLQLPAMKPSKSNQTRLTRSPEAQQFQVSTVKNVHNVQNTPRQARGLQDKNQWTIHQSNDPRTMNVFSQIRSKILNKEYWMRDENAKDCFYCGDSFSTFRRKHHCRTCGQIFDAKCTSLLSGAHFGQSGSLRVCKPCEGIINGYDDSSELSDDSSQPIPGLRPRHGSHGATDALVYPGPNHSTPVTEDSRQSPKHLDLTLPVMAIPATRRDGGESSRKAILEIDGERSLLRPSSSRSLKSSSMNRPYSIGHRRFNSRHLTQRGFKLIGDESAPFHSNPADEKAKSNRLRAFHDDNIIDPDLAPYLSDEGSSGDEQVSIMSAINGEGARSCDSEKHGFTGLLSSSKKGRSRIGERSVNGVAFTVRDAENNSASSFRSMNISRSSKRRNLSVASNLHLRPSPRAHRASTALSPAGTILPESANASGRIQVLSSNVPGSGSRMIRSSSMRGAAAPAVELNSASLQHVRRLLRQLLEDSSIPNVDNWEKALAPILLQATDDVNPDVLNGDDIDIRHYVKLKKIPGGRPGDTAYVSGLVFTKNLALKSMPRNISYPNILILTFPLEYARRQPHFMSLEPVIRQEREFLQNLVNRIVALRPQLLLVERNVSGLALEFLEKANVATAYNVKASVLEAVSRCTQTRIISSIDKLAIKPAHTGKCADFYLKTYVHGGKKKTYMFLSGCAKELGCTIVLRGAQNETLVRIKKITEFMVYVVYNLKLETCLMRDEFALIPSFNDSTSFSSLSGCINRNDMSSEAVEHNNGFSDALDGKPEAYVEKGASKSPRTEIQKTGERSNREREPSSPIVPDDAFMPEDIPMPTFYGDMVEQHKTKILSASPFVKFAQPYLLMRAREQERRLAYLKRLRDQDLEEEMNEDEISKPQKFDLIRPEMIHERIRGASKKVREVIHAVHDAEYDKALHNYKTHTKQWEAYITGNINMFDPYEHQNIAVLYSLVCTVTSVPCSGPDLLALSFYNEHEIDEEFEADCTLGQYVEDLCLGATTVCTANGCEKRMLDHHRQYVHGEAQLSVFVERYPCKLRGLQDTILMWSCCRKCGKETQVMPMSESSWKYSFGKYLELSFWSSNLRARAGVCPHDLHRDHLRYFGFQDLALRLHYDPITLLEIIVPRARITWKVDNDLRFKNELYGKIEDRLGKYMSSVKARIKSINIESVIPEKMEICKQRVDDLFIRACDEHKVLTQTLQDLYMNSKHYEVIPLNQALRATQEKVAEWDNAFADFDRNFFPSEKDIRRLATLQLRKIFLDRDDSTTSLNSIDESTTSSIPEETLIEKSGSDDTPLTIPQTRAISHEKTREMLTAVVQEEASEPKSPENAKGRDDKTITTQRLSPVGCSASDQSWKGYESNNAYPRDFSKSPKIVETGSDEATSSPPIHCPSDQKDITFSDCKQNSSTIHECGASERKKERTDTNLIEGQSSRNSIQQNVQILEEGDLRIGLRHSAPSSRARSPPGNQKTDKPADNETSTSSPKSTDIINQSSGSTEYAASKLTSGTNKATDRKLSDRLSITVLKPLGVPTHSMIPRSVATRRKDSNVSNLAKHFEQLSREFERERIRDRRHRAAKSRQTRAYPMAASRPIVEIYRNVREAVEEREPSDEDLLSPAPSRDDQEESVASISRVAESTSSQAHGEDLQAEDTADETTETEGVNHYESRIGSDAEGEGGRSEEEPSVLDDVGVSSNLDDHHPHSPSEAQLDLKLDLPKHEKSSLMKMLTNFWAERSASGWQPLDYPLNASDHVFADSDIIIREDEPSSLIAFALGSEDYQGKLRTISENFGNRYRRQEKNGHEDTVLDHDEQLEVERSLLRSTGTHLKYQFQEGSAKMLCKVFFAEQFDAVRRKCGVDERIVESLSRCLKWDSKGGKTKSVFLKTLDDRLVLKSLSPIETQSFLRFAPAYFRIMSEALFHELPSVIAKMLGFYQVIIKNPVTGVDFNWFLLVMENLFYDRSPTRIFDLKGSMRNRRIKSTGEQNEVLLDENMVEFIYESPLFSREHSKRILRASVWNDTLFLSRQNVMDYSLMIAIDENRKELVVGIIDCIRTYTWDKKLETWIKDRGKNRPTVTSPREYKNRFREAMGRYVLQAPNCWHQFKGQQVETRSFNFDDQNCIKDGEGELEFLRVS